MCKASTHPRPASPTPWSIFHSGRCCKNSYLVGALSTVNHKVQYQGWKQSWIYPLVIHFTRRYATSFSFSNHNSNYINNFGTQTHKSSNPCFGTYVYSANTQHGNLHQLCATMSKVTLLFCGPIQEPVLATANTGKKKKKTGEVLENVMK